MITTECVIVGSGGLGRGVLDLVESVNNSDRLRKLVVVGVLDDAPSDEDRARILNRGYEWLGPLAVAARPKGRQRSIGYRNHATILF